jgi:hypothetical protein
VREQRQDQRVVAPRGIGATLESAPNWAILGRLPAAALELAAGPAPEAIDDLPASKRFGTCRQQILEQRRTALAETSDINKLRHQTLSMRFAVINKAESMMLTSGNCTASNCQTTRQKLRGLVTYGPRQSLTSFAASKDEFLRNKIHIKLARFNEHRQCRKNRIACFIADVVILCRLVFGRHDF